MYFNVALKFMLIISIVLQSFTAVASATTDAHQVDFQHLQTVHDHADDIQLVKQDKAPGEHDIKDCHHCGHCSGSHLSWVLVKNMEMSFNALHAKAPLFMIEQPISFLDAIFRPPIS